MDNAAAINRIMLAINRIDGLYYLFAENNHSNENTLAFLYAMNDGQPHSQKEISTIWLIPRTTINTIVKKMLAEGYVIFLTSEHSKEKKMLLTEKGIAYAESILKDIYAAEEAAITDTLAKYPPQFIEAMEYFSHALQDKCNAISHKEDIT